MAAALFALIFSAAAAVIPACEETWDAPKVAVGDAVFLVEALRTQQDRVLGLSGRESLAPGTGALFIYEPGRASSFWMKGMMFDLDFVWIGDDCTVVDVTEQVPRPAPGTANRALPIYSPREPATYNLEINAGEAERSGIAPGAAVAFHGLALEPYGC